MSATLLYLGATISTLFLVDRALLAMESRGWVYWRCTKTRPSGGLGNAFQALQEILEPGQRHVIEQKLEDREERDADGEGGDPDARADRPPTGGAAFEADRQQKQGR